MNAVRVPMDGWNLQARARVFVTGSLLETLMKTLSRHLAETFTSQYCTRVEPQTDGRLVVHVGYPINGTEATRVMAGHQVQNTLLVETILEDMRNELARPH